MGEPCAVTILAFLLLLHMTPARAEERRVEKIEFEGLEQTERETLERELRLRAGASFSEAGFETGLQRLRNLRIFRRVDGLASETGRGNVAIKIRVVEKQTFLPFFRMKKGGGATLVVLGVGDLNAFGRGIELLPQYESLNSRWHGGRLEYRVPWAFQQPATLEGQMARETRIHTLFGDQEARGHWRQSRWLAQSSWEHSLTEGIQGALGIHWTHDTFGSDGLDANQKEINQRFGFVIPDSRQSTMISARIDVGEIAWDDFRARGTLLSPGVSARFDGPQRRLNATMTARGHFRLAKSLDAAVRLVFESGSLGARTPVERSCSIGGFAEVRGFLEERFRGNSCWFSNAELRWTAWHHPWLAFQPAAFWDAGAATRTSAPFSFHPPRDPSSVGLGFRIIFPGLARLQLRFDYAVPTSGSRDGAPFSLGSQQFFN